MEKVTKRTVIVKKIDGSAVSHEEISVAFNDVVEKVLYGKTVDDKDEVCSMISYAFPDLENSMEELYCEPKYLKDPADEYSTELNELGEEKYKEISSEMKKRIDAKFKDLTDAMRELHGIVVPEITHKDFGYIEDTENADFADVLISTCIKKEEIDRCDVPEGEVIL